MKKIFTAVIVTMIVWCMIITSSAWAQTVNELKLGDADGDGKTDINDALAVALYDCGMKIQNDMAGFTGTHHQKVLSQRRFTRGQTLLTPRAQILIAEHPVITGFLLKIPAGSLQNQITHQLKVIQHVTLFHLQADSEPLQPAGLLLR